MDLVYTKFVIMATLKSYNFFPFNLEEKQHTYFKWMWKIREYPCLDSTYDLYDNDHDSVLQKVFHPLGFVD